MSSLAEFVKSVQGEGKDDDWDKAVVAALQQNDILVC